MLKSSGRKFRHLDPFLEEVVNDLIRQYKCHTVLIYGSRARGDYTATSDYDLMGVRKTGGKYRLSENRRGKYLDAFIFTDKDLKIVGDPHLYMKGAKILFEKNDFGTQFLKKLEKAIKTPCKPLADDELNTRKVWAYKMFERIQQGDVEGLYRRSWLHEALLADYFHFRKERYWGSKESFHWLKTNDLKTYRLFENVLKSPSDMKVLKKLLDRVVHSI